MSIRDPGQPRGLRRDFLATVALGALAATAGCGRSFPSEASQVWGCVLSNGKPVTRGTVVFKPLMAHDVTWGAGPIDETGRFWLTSSLPEVSLQPGRYGVYLRPPLKTDRAAGRLVDDPDYPVPAKYLDPEAILIQVEIKNEPTRLDFHLND